MQNAKIKNQNENEKIQNHFDPSRQRRDTKILHFDILIFN